MKTDPTWMEEFKDEFPLLFRPHLGEFYEEISFEMKEFISKLLAAEREAGRREGIELAIEKMKEAEKGAAQDAIACFDADDESWYRRMEACYADSQDLLRSLLDPTL